MPRPLRVAIERRPHTAALLDGTIPPPLGLDVEFVTVSPINRAFRRMVRDLEFDVCEMAIVTHYLARSHGVPILALPVFLAGHYPHPSIEGALGAKIESPRDLEGKRVGSRSFTMTSAVWARGVLARQYGVDLSAITWVVADEDNVPDVESDLSVDRRPGVDLKRMLRSGELEAGIGLGLKDESVRPLWTDPEVGEKEWFGLAGGPPLNHTVVVGEARLDSSPELGPALVEWFEAGRAVSESGPEYGLTPENRSALDTLLDISRTDFPHEAHLPDHAVEVFIGDERS